MSSSIKKEAIVALQQRKTNGKGIRVGICYTQWNTVIMDALLTGCRDELLLQGVRLEDIVVECVPGSYELPFAAHQLIQTQKVDVVICLGCLIKGDTKHFEYICEAVTQGIMKLNLDPANVPVMFGVLACLNEDQALHRAGLGSKEAGSHNHGIEWAQSALEMVQLKQRLSASSCCCPWKKVLSMSPFSSGTTTAAMKIATLSCIVGTLMCLRHTQKV